jgi:hypothetical protein
MSQQNQEQSALSQIVANDKERKTYNEINQQVNAWIDQHIQTVTHQTQQTGPATTTSSTTVLPRPPLLNPVDYTQGLSNFNITPICPEEPVHSY